MDSNQIEGTRNEEKTNENNRASEDETILLETIKSYFSGPNKDVNDKIQDLSYETWVEKNQNIKKLCEVYEVNYTDNKKNLYGNIENHDFSCELKLLKWITEDEAHTKNFIKIEKKLNKLNHLNDILPYEYNAVTIDKNNSNKNDINNYINASYISNPLDNKSELFIATQTPLHNTIFSFWKMIYSHKIKLIIMSSDLSEEKEEKYKIYWPKNKGEKLQLKEGDLELNIELFHREEIAPQVALLRKFKINNEIEVKQIQIISWKEHGLPDEEYLVNIVFEKIFKCINEHIKEKVPVVVHCLDGVGRTGTLISIFIINMLLEELKKIKSEPMMCVFNVIRKLREQRYSFVTDIEQYKYIYNFSFYWIKKNYPLD